MDNGSLRHILMIDFLKLIISKRKDASPELQRCQEILVKKFRLWLILIYSISADITILVAS